MNGSETAPPDENKAFISVEIGDPVNGNPYALRETDVYEAIDAVADPERESLLRNDEIVKIHRVIGENVDKPKLEIEGDTKQVEEIESWLEYLSQRPVAVTEEEKSRFSLLFARQTLNHMKEHRLNLQRENKKNKVY